MDGKMTEKQEETCENCGHEEGEHTGEKAIICTGDWLTCTCKKFKAKTSLDKKSKEEPFENYTNPVTDDDPKNHSPLSKRICSSITNKDTPSVLHSSEGTFNLSEKILHINRHWVGGEEFYVREAISLKDVKEFIKKNDKVIIEEINKTDGSIDFDLNNLYARICRRTNKLAGEDLR